MFRHGFVWRLIATLLFVGLLVAGGFALFRAGFAQGYQVAALTAKAGSTGSTAPAVPGAGMMPFYGMYPRYGFGPGFGFPGFFSPFRFLFGIGFFFLMLFLVGGFIRMMVFGSFMRRRWAAAGQPGNWEHGPWGHGPWRSGPWGQGPEGQPNPESGKEPTPPQQGENK